MNKFFYIATLSLLGTIIVHILTILLIPILIPHKAFERYNRPEFYYHFITPPKNDILTKDKDPLIDLAVCTFNLNQGPVRLYSPEEVPFWSFSIYDENGVNRYSLNSKVIAGHHLDVMISDLYQMVALKHKHMNPQKKSIILDNNFKQGFIVLRSLKGFKPQDENNDKAKIFLQQAICQPFF